jgi:hypothetical protein
LAWYVALAHLGLVLLAIAAILSGGEPDWPMAWIVFLFLDFPISLVLALFSSVGSALPSHVHLVQGYFAYPSAG